MLSKEQLAIGKIKKNSQPMQWARSYEEYIGRTLHPVYSPINGRLVGHIKPC